MIQKTGKLNYDKQYQWAVNYIRALQCAAGFVNITYFITGDGFESLCALQDPWAEALPTDTQSERK